MRHVTKGGVTWSPGYLLTQWVVSSHGPENGGKSPVSETGQTKPLAPMEVTCPVRGKAREARNCGLLWRQGWMGCRNQIEKRMNS